MTTASKSATLPPSTAIVGAGPTGLFTAIVLARRGYQNITVYDRLPRPDDPSSPDWGNPYRSYNLGLGARGQIALGAAEVWNSIEPFCAQAIGRKDWTPEQGERPEQIYTERAYKTQVIQRDRIASCLLSEVENKYKDQISVLHDTECVGLTWLDEETGGREKAKGGSPQRRGVRVRLHRELEEGKLDQWTEDARWVIGADGVRSALRGALEAKTTPSPNNKKTEKPVRAYKLPERNEFVYKILPLDLRPKYGTGPGWRPDLNYSARTKGEVTIEALPTKEGVYVGVVLFRPTCPAIARIKDKEDARQFFAGSFPQFIDVIKEEDLARFATGPTFRLPSFSYAGPNINYKDNTLLLGDCIHSVKPYFGLGLNSALEDVMSLDRCLEETGDDLAKALPLFSSRIAPQAKALVEFQASFDYDAKTTEGFLRFILPLILDGIFHRYFPTIFAPNGIRLLQDHRSSFTQTRRRKRRDRIGQVLVIGTVAAGLGKAVGWVVREGVRVWLKR
ncbi:fad dependent oxidoreductase [Nannochloropsis oceanica]